MARGTGHLPQPGVGLGPAAGHQVGEAGHGPPGLGVEAVTGLVKDKGGIEHPAVDVELVLGPGGVSDADGTAPQVAGPSLELSLVGRRGADEAEQRPEPGAVEAAGVQQPVQEGSGLLVPAGGQEGGDADAGIAGPGVAVVPVAEPAHLLGKRGGRGGHWRPRGRVGQQLEGEQAAEDRLSVGADVSDARRPGPPPRLGLAQLCPGLLGRHMTRGSAWATAMASTRGAPRSTTTSRSRPGSIWVPPLGERATARAPQVHTRRPERRSTLGRRWLGPWRGSKQIRAATGPPRHSRRRTSKVVGKSGVEPSPTIPSIRVSSPAPTRHVVSRMGEPPR